MNRCPFLCHPERSRGICSSADHYWKRGLRSSKRILIFSNEPGRRVEREKTSVFIKVNALGEHARSQNPLVIRTRAGEMTILFERRIPRFQERSAELQIPRLRSG